MEKITYASLGSLGDDFHQAFEAGLEHLQGRLGRTHPIFLGGRKKTAKAGVFPDTSPIDTRIELGRFQSAGREETARAVATAKAALRDWRDLGWEQRVAFLRKAAELMTERQFRLAALLTMEVGKNRFEAIAEVSESVDLILYYCRQMELHQGFTMAMGGQGTEVTRSVLKPYGVWAIVSPFNFPLALATGMAAAALVAGNTIVLKPASDAPWTGLMLYEILHEAGLPVGVVSILTGSGSEIGEEFIANPDVAGLAFTGSRAVGEALLARFGRHRPCIAEMGGKNPTVVMPSANLDDAAEGIVRAAFGFGGQKCSACSRLYVHTRVAAPLLDRLVDKTRALVIGDPTRRETFLGPLINAAAVARYEAAIKLAKKEGRLLCGGKRPSGDGREHGHYVEPVIADRLPTGSRLFREELFVPLLVVAEVRSLAEAIQRCNDSDYGLTAGIFTEEEHEREEFFAEIEAGVVYANRRGGATTGAWPGVQSFGGWKHSGSTGRNALGWYYVPQFMREQSQTVMRRTAS
ncbi:MAG TPA: aldehyde dehydrogenase family protein [Methylomirabilota bacterium]|nr:aldehyde dehydrogenase family protein [Methylomirabilota bacterium]